MYHNKGISKKSGNPYENWKCGTCKKVDWVDDVSEQKAITPMPARPSVDWDEIRERKEDGMEWLNAKNNAALITAALIRSGNCLPENVTEVYENLATKIYNFKETK